MNHLQQLFTDQRFANGFELVDGVAMCAANPTSFHIPPDVIKKHVRADQFVEVRIDSPRFSVHEDAREKCTCPSCQGEMTKPILRHPEPDSLYPMLPPQVPSRGWGEDFWVRITERCGNFLCGVIDNHLIESRLHELRHGDEIVLGVNHILAVHESHKLELVSGMSQCDLKELARWLAQSKLS